MAEAVATVEKEERPNVGARVVRIRVRSLDSLLAYGLIVAVVLWRTSAVLRSTFLQDDWVWVSRASLTPFLRYVTGQYNGHLQPGQFAWVWLVTKLAPLNYGLAVTPVLLTTFVGGVLMWKFLRALFGDRPANLVPLAVFMLCPLSVPPAMWWATGLGIIPLQVFIVATLFAVLRFVRSPSPGRLAAVGLVYAGALLWWEKSLLILPLAALFVLLFLGDGRGWARLRGVTAGRWQLWGVLGGISAAYLGWYLSVAKWQLTNRPTLVEVGRLANRTLGYTLIPTYVGGPWSVSHLSVSPWGFVNELARGPRLITWALAAVLVMVSLVVRRAAWRAWVLPSVYASLCVLLVASGRLRFAGYVIGEATRYVADSVPVFAIGLALAFMVPLERRNDPGWARRVIVLDRGQGDQGLKGSAPPEPIQGTARSRWSSSRSFALGLVLIYATSALITSFKMVAAPKGNSAKEWLATVKSEVALHPTASVVNDFVPSSAVLAVAFPEVAKFSRALAPITPHIRWNAPDEHMLMFDTTGHLRPVQVGRLTTARPGPVLGCGYLVNGAPVTVPLKGKLFSWNWGVSLSYASNAPALGFITVDGDRQLVRFLRGHHALTLVHIGTATTVTIEGGASRICVGDVVVGGLRPAAG